LREITVMKLIIPEVVGEALKNSWFISYYTEDRHHLFPVDDELHEDVQKLISFTEAFSLSSPFRREVTILDYPLLVAIFPAERKILVGKRYLGSELVLLNAVELWSAHLKEEELRLILNLKDHIDLISQMNQKEFPSEIDWVTFNEGLPRFLNGDQWEDVNQHSKLILNQIVKNVSAYRSSLFEKFSDYGLNLTAQFDLIRIHLLKFLALLPSLDHDKKGHEVKRNLVESLKRLLLDASKGSEKKKLLPTSLLVIFKIAYPVAKVIPAKPLAYIVRFLVKKMAKRFIAGESIMTSHQTISELRRTSRQCTLDQLGELVVSAKEADEYFEKVLQLIHGLKEHIPRGEKNGAGILNAHVSIKVSALSHDFKSHAFEETYQKVYPRLKRILQEAQREEVFINIDAEHYHYRDLVLQIYSRVLLETPELSQYSQTGIVLQAYLRDASSHLDQIIQLAKKRKVRMPIRLVKGAYWDAETVEADAHEFTPPQFLNKEESDIHFRQLCYKTLKNYQDVQLTIGSHNLQDHAFVESLRTLRFPQAPVIEHQCLHMTYEALSHGLAKMNWPVRNYMPIGNLIVGMAYLVRRIMENSSQVGVLSIMRSHQKASGLISPVDVHVAKRKNGDLKFDKFITLNHSKFAPVRPLRLFIHEEWSRLSQEFLKFKKGLEEHQDQWLNTEAVILSSSDPSLKVGEVFKNKAEDVSVAFENASNALKQSDWWRRELFSQRISVLIKTADLMLKRRNELSSLMILEAGKTFSEALADVDEAIDFLNYYARLELNLQSEREDLTSRGIIGVIAPWNFPLAIPCGMAAAPLVAGNAVILKPAEQTPLIARELVKLFYEAGLPSDLLQFVHGDGEVVGAGIVNHPDCAGVVFTGSKPVGQLIYSQLASKLHQHPFFDLTYSKKVITEMGGKNAVIVTNNCELDETVSGILYSAFGHAGQKCSATSRVIVHKDVKDALISRLVGAMNDLKVGEAYQTSTSINPLITKEDQERVKLAVKEASDEAIKCGGHIWVDRSFEKLPGYCVGPALIELPYHQAFKADSWAQREIFGPVVHIIEYSTLTEAVELFNATEYALTGGIFAQSQDDIDFLLKYLQAGNLYVNRPNTGARVAIEPFGGFKLSGTGPKAGGKNYVHQFHVSSIIDRSVVRLSHINSEPSGYQLLRPLPFNGSMDSKIKLMENLAMKIHSQYEIHNGGTSELEKRKLIDFIAWVKTSLKDTIQKKDFHHVIPGQLSYCDHQMLKESSLMIMADDELSIHSLLFFLGALVSGTGVSISCLTSGSYQKWKLIVDLAHKMGYSKSSIDISTQSLSELQTLLDQENYQVVFREAPLELKKEYENILLPHASLTKHMRYLLSPLDFSGEINFKSYVIPFWYERAFAINTMRHGAPLETQE